MPNKQLLQSAGDGTAVPAGYVGESIINILASPISTSAGNTYTVATINNLTPGVWLLLGSLRSDTPTAASPQNVLTLKNGATALRSSSYGLSGLTGRAIGSTSVFDIVLVSGSIPTITMTVDAIGTSSTVQGYIYSGDTFLRAIRIA